MIFALLFYFTISYMLMHFTVFNFYSFFCLRYKICEISIFKRWFLRLRSDGNVHFILLALLFTLIWPKYIQRSYKNSVEICISCALCTDSSMKTFLKCQIIDIVSMILFHNLIALLQYHALTSP